MADTFQQLARHLDNLPAGFPATESGVELRILKRLFTAEEAEIAVNLTLVPEPASAVAQQLGRDEAELASHPGKHGPKRIAVPVFQRRAESIRGRPVCGGDLGVSS